MIKGMIFEGGGPAGIGHIGAIEIFEKNNQSQELQSRTPMIGGKAPGVTATYPRAGLHICI